METEAIRIGVVMQRRPLSSIWQPYQWHPLEIITDAALLQHAPRRLRNDAADVRWLFGGFDLRLYSDEAEGYFLNVHAPAPCWFVMWRPEQIDGEEVAVPKAVTLSYNEAARLMDGGEQVDTVPAEPGIVGRLAAFVQAHYRPEPKQKRKKPSFEGGAEVQHMAEAERGAHGR